MVEVVFLKGTDPLARTIRWWTGGVYAHCAFRLWRCLVIDTDLIHGVRARFDPWPSTDSFSVRLEPNALLDRLYASRWVRYSLIEGLRAKLPFFPDDPNKWNCSEMVYDMLFPTGQDRCVTPDDLYQLLHSKRR